MTASVEMLLRSSMGLDVETIGRSGLERAVGRRMTVLGLTSADAYAEAVRADPDELQELIEAVVVPETWFFRQPDAFAALGTWVSQRAATSSATLRVLSAPCSTGEEPYSIAMTLLERLPADRFTIHAVDISLRNLAVAERGVYGSNSFRSEYVPSAPHFLPAPKGFAVSDAPRSAVRFRHGNLLMRNFLFDEPAYDVIFCRNLLIYFDIESQKGALRAVDRLLAPRGVLFLGPADGFLALQHGFVPAGRVAAMAYQRSRDVDVSPRRGNGAARGPASIPGTPARPVPPRVHQNAARPRPHVATVQPDAAVERPDLSHARMLADSGRMEDAANVCQRLLELEGPSPDVYYLLGVVSDAQRDRSRALEYYRKATYLDPHHTEALSQLALVAAESGDTRRAAVLASRGRRAALNAAAGAGERS